MKKFIFDTWHGTFFILLLVTILLFVSFSFSYSTTIYFELVTLAVFFVAPVISIIGWIISLLKLKWGRAVVQFFSIYIMVYNIFRVYIASGCCKCSY